MSAYRWRRKCTRWHGHPMRSQAADRVLDGHKLAVNILWWSSFRWGRYRSYR